MPVISLHKVFSNTGFKVERAQVNFWYSIVAWHILHPSTVYVFFLIQTSLRKLRYLPKKKSCAVLGDWKQSISNHLYWCAASRSGDGKQVEAKWLSIFNHVTNVHEGHSETFPRCLHGPLPQEWKWLRRGTNCKTSQ